jgi:HSP20 family protein
LYIAYVWRIKTMAITRFDPFHDFTDFPDGLRLFRDTVGRMLNEPRSTRPWTPAVDVLETENELVLKADVPDVEMKDVSVEIENGTLTLKGERKFENEEKGVGYHRLERSYGSFARYFSVPDTVEADKVKADYKKGVLTVTLPKKELAKPRAIKVEVQKD